MDERKLETEDWSSDSGETFRICRWRARGEDPIDTLLLIHHGLGEHCGRYNRFAQGLADLRADIWSYDLRGHGKSGGPRGHAAGLDQLVDDLEMMMSLALERTGAKHLFLLGHSLGGAVVVHYLVRRKPHPAIAGVIVCAPPMRIEKTPSVRLKLAIGSVLGRVVPKLALGSGLDPKGISSLPEEVQAYEEDPLIHDKISAALGVSLTSDSEANLGLADRIELPLLVYHGGDDPIVNIEDSRALHETASSKDKTIHEFPGLKHEIQSESAEEREKLCSMVSDWISERM